MENARRGLSILVSAALAGGCGMFLGDTLDVALVAEPDAGPSGGDPEGGAGGDPRDGGPAVHDAAPLGTSEGDDPSTFADDFERADGPVDNGWLEKTAGQFSLLAGAVVEADAGFYENAILYRPAAEAVRDVDVSVRVTMVEGTVPGLVARLTGNLVEKDRMFGYTFFTNASALTVTREDVASMELASKPIQPSLVDGATYELRFRVTGTDPVRLEGTLLALDRTVLQSLTAFDSSSSRLSDAGTVGLGSGTKGARYDGFRRVALP